MTFLSVWFEFTRRRPGMATPLGHVKA
jgi:hypothetical protein